VLLPDLVVFLSTTDVGVSDEVIWQARLHCLCGWWASEVQLDVQRGGSEMDALYSMGMRVDRGKEEGVGGLG
jgi:hypothetical protein